MQPARQPNSKRLISLSQAKDSAVPLSRARHARRLKIGRILLDAGLISAESLKEALVIAHELDQPIGKVLITTEQITEKNLQSALLAQSMIAEGVAEERLAIESQVLRGHRQIIRRISQ